METPFIMYYIISYQVMTQYEKDHLTLDCSPEFCFKHLIYKYLLETGHALGDYEVGHFRSKNHNLSVFKCCLPADATYQISGL